MEVMYGSPYRYFIFVIKITQNLQCRNFFVTEINGDNFKDDSARNKRKMFTYFIKCDTSILFDEFVITQKIICND